MPTLNCLTRDDDIPSASKVPCRLLGEVPDLSAGQPYTGNMLMLMTPRRTFSEGDDGRDVWPQE